MRKVVLIPIVFGATALACGEEASTSSRSGPEQRAYQLDDVLGQEVYYDQIEAGSYAAWRPLSLCQLVSRSEFAGLYEVVSIRGVTEEVPTRPGVLEGVTYVTLERRHEWTWDAPENAVARVSGGPLFHLDLVSGWFISLAVGDQLGVMLTPPTSRNRNFPTMHEWGLFKPTGGGSLSNGQLFTTSAVAEPEIARLVAEIDAAQPGCQVDHYPDVLTQTVPAKPERIEGPTYVQGVTWGDE